MEHIVACGLHILSGGRPKDQRFIFGSCRDAVYKSFIDFVNAVNMAPELSINMPSTQEEWDTITGNTNTRVQTRSWLDALHVLTVSFREVIGQVKKKLVT